MYSTSLTHTCTHTHRTPSREKDKLVVELQLWELQTTTNYIWKGVKGKFTLWLARGKTSVKIKYQNQSQIIGNSGSEVNGRFQNLRQTRWNYEKPNEA